MIDMVRTDKPLCPLQSIGQAEPVPCAGKLCAWWDRLSASCCVAFVADSIGIVSDSLEALTGKIPASAANTDGDEWGNAETLVSASNDTRETEGLQE